jgi:hypothetical protein
MTTGIRKPTSARYGVSLVLTIILICNTTLIAGASDTDDWGAFQLLGEEVAPGTHSKIQLIHDRSFERLTSTCRYLLAGEPNRGQRYA